MDQLFQTNLTDPSLCLLAIDYLYTPLFSWYWMYTKKVDKYDIIRIKKKTSRRNKKCQEKSPQNTQMNLNRQ